MAHCLRTLSRGTRLHARRRYSAVFKSNKHCSTTATQALLLATAPHTVSWDTFARPPPILSGGKLVGLEASRHVSAGFSQLPSWENWLGRCWWLRDLSRRSCRKDPDLGSLVGKSAIRTQHMVSWVPFGYLSVIVGLSMDGRLISKSTTLASLSHENCKRATKFVNLALADTENPTVFSALQGAPLQRL